MHHNFGLTTVVISKVKKTQPFNKETNWRELVSQQQQQQQHFIFRYLYLVLILTLSLDEYLEHPLVLRLAVSRPHEFLRKWSELFIGCEAAKRATIS